MEPEAKKSTKKHNRNNNGEKEGVKYMKKPPYLDSIFDKQ